MVTEMQADVETREENAAPSKVDVNRASVDEMTTLPGVGPRLAERMVAYRDARGPFLIKEDLLDVPGMDETTYEAVKDDIVIRVPTSKELVEQETLSTAEDEAVELEAPPRVPQIEAEAQAEATITPEAEEVEKPRHERVETVEQQGMGLAWLWTAALGAILGGLLGLFFSLLAFAGINGAIDINRTEAVQDVRGEISGMAVQMDALQSDISGLQGDVQGLRERVEVLSGLTARVENAELAVEDLTAETTALREDADALESTVAAIDEEVTDLNQAMDEVQAETERAMTFFGRLRSLMNDLFGDVEPTAEPESALPIRQEVAG